MREFYPDLPYLVTISTWGHAPLLNSTEKKSVVLKHILRAIKIYGAFDFSLMSDHLHLYFEIERVPHIPKVVQIISGASTHQLHKDSLLTGKIFETSHLTYIRNELGADRARGYVIGNPIKHQEIRSLDELVDYPFSSFKDVYKTDSEAFAKEIVFSAIAYEDDQVGITEAD